MKAMIRQSLGRFALVALMSSLSASAAAQTYFPNPPGNGYEGQHVVAAGQRTLWQRRDEAGLHAYQFVWARSFHHPVLVRIEMKGGVARLQAWVLTGKGGFDSGTVGRTVTRDLTAAEHHEVIASFERSDWRRLAPDEQSAGLDGARWTLEAAGGAGYHVTRRWSPESGTVRAIGLLLLGLANIRITPREVY
jgi:hypothetical protein